MSSRLIPIDLDIEDGEVWGRQWISKYEPKYNPRFLRRGDGSWFYLGPVGDTLPIVDFRIVRALERERNKRWRTPLT